MVQCPSGIAPYGSISETRSRRVEYPKGAFHRIVDQGKALRRPSLFHCRWCNALRVLHPTEAFPKRAAVGWNTPKGHSTESSTKGKPCAGHRCFAADGTMPFGYCTLRKHFRNAQP